MMNSIWKILAASAAMAVMPLTTAQETLNGGIERTVSDIGILPGFKSGARVSQSERNPYAKRVVEKAVQLDGESEAAKIIRLLEGLRVRGYSKDDHGDIETVLYGDLKLRAGAEVPQLLPEQNDKLVVSRLTNDEVELSWRAEAGKKVGDGRKVIIVIDLQPRVQVVLPGRPNSEKVERAWLGAEKVRGGEPAKKLLPTSGN